MKPSAASPCEQKSIFGHWIWVVPALLLAAALTLYQADSFPPTVDEFATMVYAGIVEGGYAPLDLLHSVFERGVASMPGYHFLVSAWTSLTAYDIAAARILGIQLYLLVIALCYRLGKDLVAPVAGLFAVVIVMSNAFINFYIPHARPYMLFVLLACLTVWLYLRITTLRAQPKPIDYLSLGLAVFALVMTHLFSATLLFTLGVYHLIFVPKRSRWLLIGLVVIIAVLLCLPVVALSLSQYNTAYEHLDGQPLNAFESVSIWLRLMLNNQTAVFAAIAVSGLYVGQRRDLIRMRAAYLLLPLFVITIFLLGEFTGLLRAQAMRHQLDGLPLLVLFVAAGHFALFRWKRWLGITVILWIFAGLAFQADTNWWTYIGFRSAVFLQPPIQSISRIAGQSDTKPILVGYPYDEFLAYALNHRGHAGAQYGISPGEYYFSQYGMGIHTTDDPAEFAEHVGALSLHSPFIWHIHKDNAASEDRPIAAEVMSHLNYRWCGAIAAGLDTVVQQYSWTSLACQSPATPATSHSELIEYEYYSATLNADADTLFVVGRWMPRKDFERNSYQISYQLISLDWQNVAQLDLPLVAEGELRRYAIDVSRAPAGVYRLVLILYDVTTGERLPWEGDPGHITEILQLGEVTLGGA